MDPEPGPRYYQYSNIMILLRTLSAFHSLYTPTYSPLSFELHDVLAPSRTMPGFAYILYQR